MRRRIAFLAAAFAALCMPAFAGDFDADIAGSLERRGFLLTLLIVYAGGVMVSLTPCVYPMIPITLGAIGARSAATRSALHGLARSLVFVLGIALVYTVLGYVAVSTGRSVSFAFQNTWVVSVIALFFVAMGLSMLDLFVIQMPAMLAGRLQSGANRGGFLGAFLMGAVTGVVASPCGSPVLAGVVVIAAESGKAAIGVGLLFAYAVGLGTLFVVLGTFPALIGKAPRSGEWMEDVKKLLGLVLIGVGVYFFKDVLPAFGFMVLAVVTGFVGALVMAMFATRRREALVLRVLWRIGAAASLLFGAGLLVVGVMNWRAAAVERAQAERIAAISGVPTPMDPLAPAAGDDAATTTAAGARTGADDFETSLGVALELARTSGKPVMVDFTAKWCAACKRLERETFSDPRVAAKLEQFVKVRVDCTKDDGTNSRLQKQYNALTLPAIVFLSPSGEAKADASLYEFEAPDQFLARLARVKP